MKAKKTKKKVSFIIERVKNKNKQKIYKANSNILDITKDKNENKEIAHITQKVTNKLQSIIWIADTEVSSYIINKLDLFRSSLIWIKRRTIKIERERLYLDQIRTIIIRSRKKKAVDIMRIYYILDLKTNLLLYRRLYILKLNKRFNTNSIILYINNKNILKADYKKGVYMLT